MSLSLKFKFSLLVKRVVLLNAAFAKAILQLISCVHVASCYHASEIFEIFHIFQLSLICQHMYWGWFP